MIPAVDLEQALPPVDGWAEPWTRRVVGTRKNEPQFIAQDEERLPGAAKERARPCS